MSLRIVIIAGGSGTRLWPLSRSSCPKQFLPLGGDSLTLLQQTLARVEGLSAARPLVVCNEDHRFLVAEQLRAVGANTSIMLEPVGRNTAPALALAAMQALKQCEFAEPHDMPVLLVLAADHVIQDVGAFHKAVRQLLPSVRSGKFGTLGIVPTEAATGFGYIRVAEPLSGSGLPVSQTELVESVSQEDCVQPVLEFVEKPELAAAQEYVDSGRYYWNSGMFLVRADRYLEALAEYRPDIMTACEKAIAGATEDMDFIRVGKAEFEACPSESVDYAVMEPLAALDESDPQVVVAPLDAGWSDVGSWSALWDIAEKCENGNAILNVGQRAGQKAEAVILEQTSNSLVVTNDRLVTVLGLDNVVVVDTADAVLVAHKDKVQDVKRLVGRLESGARLEHIIHREVYRPWGKYDALDRGDGYLVKRITVKPGGRLSVQRHQHRAEHWVVVSGVARVTNGDAVYTVAENESTFIPIGQVHSLENPGVLDLQMIEVQSGSYIGEDDIERLNDIYGRV